MPTTLLMNHLIDVNKKLAKYVSSSDYDGFLSTLLSIQPGTHSTIICHDNGALFRLAASASTLLFIQKMISLVPHHFEHLVKAQDFAAFREAASHDQHDVLRYFSTLLPHATEDMIKARHFEPFREAASRGSTDTVKTLATLGKDQLKSMIAAEGFIAFKLAIINGHLDTAKYLFSMAGDYSVEMVSFNQYEAFRLAAKHGHLAILKWLLSEFNAHSPLMMSALDYGAISLAAQHGHAATVEFLLSLLTSLETRFALSLPTQFACRNAAEAGHLSLLTTLFNSVGKHLPELIVNHFPACFLLAARNEHVEILMALIKLAPNYLREMLTFQRCAAINHAIINNKQNLIRFFDKNAHSVIFDLLDEETYDTFCTLVNGTELYMGDDFFDKIEAGASSEVIEHLEWLDNHSQLEQLALDDQHAFNLAAQHGHIDILNRLIDFYPYSPYDIITEGDNALLHTAAEYQQQTVLRTLFSLVDKEDIRALIQDHDYALIGTACQTGNMDLFQYLCDLSQDTIETILDRCENKLFKITIENGHFHLLRQLIRSAPENWDDFWESHLVESMANAAKKGHISILDYLLQQIRSPTPFLKKILENNQQALKQIIQNGYMDIVAFISERLTLEQKNTLCEDEIKYELLCSAISSGDIQMCYKVNDVLNDASMALTSAETIVALFEFAIKANQLDIAWHFIEIIPNYRNSLLQLHDYALFRHAVKTKNLSLTAKIVNYCPEALQFMLLAKNAEAIKHLITAPESPLLAYLCAMAPQAFGMHLLNDARRIFLNIKKHTSLLKHLLYIPDIFYVIFDKSDELETMEPFLHKLIADAAVDGIPPGNAYLGLHALAWCIEHNAQASTDYAIQLLASSAIKHCVNQTLEQFEHKNLLELAIKHENMSVARALYRIPAVQRFANSDAFNQKDPRQISVRHLAMDQESSVTSLRSAERMRLEACLDNYRSQLKSSSTRTIFLKLKEELSDLYTENAASYRDDQGHLHFLPISWEEFNEMELSAENRETALKAYYSHREHTVLRFLSKPNRWLAHDAEFVKEDFHDPSQRWAYFEDYQETISLLYLAATDTTIGEHEGFDTYARKEEFFNALALIARAHNWDNHEADCLEHDDYSEGDRPSCYSGILRRLFHSVKGHPTLMPIGKSQIDLEIRDFVSAKLIANIPYRCIYRIKEELDKLFALEAADINFLKSFDITDEEINYFIGRLKTKYHLDDWSLILYADYRLTVNKEDCHLSVFYAECHLEQFFRAHRRNARVTPMYGHQHNPSSLPDQTNESHRKRVRFR